MLCTCTALFLLHCVITFVPAMAWYDIVLYGMVWYGMVWYGRYADYISFIMWIIEYRLCTVISFS